MPKTSVLELMAQLHAVSREHVETRATLMQAIRNLQKVNKEIYNAIVAGNLPEARSKAAYNDRYAQLVYDGIMAQIHASVTRGVGGGNA